LRTQLLLLSELYIISIIYNLFFSKKVEEGVGEGNEKGH